MTTLFSNRYCLTCKTSVLYFPLIDAHTIPLNSTVDGPTEYEECHGPFVDSLPEFEEEQSKIDNLFDMYEDQFTELDDFIPEIEFDKFDVDLDDGDEEYGYSDMQKDS